MYSLTTLMFIFLFSYKKHLNYDVKRSDKVRVKSLQAYLFLTAICFISVPKVTLQPLLIKQTKKQIATEVMIAFL